MFIKSMQEISNLIDNATVQPIGGIRLLLKQEKEVEFVRQSFRNLFCEDGGDLDKRQERIDEFIDTVNAKIEKYVNGSWKYPQSRNSVIYYLNLWKPEENYIFKSTEATAWANCIEYGDDFGSGKSTLLEAIAVASGFDPEGGRKNYAFSTYDSYLQLYEAVHIAKGYRQAKWGYFLRAESFYNVATKEEYADWEHPSEKYHEKSHGESFLALAQNYL
jgi:hypothetical protein